MLRQLILIATLALSFSTQAVNDSKLAVGFSAGNFSFDDGTSEADSSVGSLFAQYGQISDNFDLEFGLVNLGSYENNDLTTELSALTASLVSQWGDYYGIKPFAKVGYGFMKMNRAVDLFGIQIEAESTGDILTAGLGLNYSNASFSNLTMRLSYDLYYFQTTNVSTEDDESNNVQGLSLGFMYRFK